MVVWGIVSTLMGLVHNYSGLMAVVRIFQNLRLSNNSDIYLLV